MSDKKKSIAQWARAYYEAITNQNESTTTANVGSYPVAFPSDPIDAADTSGVCPFSQKKMSPRCKRGLKAYLRKRKRKRKHS